MFKLNRYHLILENRLIFSKLTFKMTPTMKTATKAGQFMKVSAEKVLCHMRQKNCTG